MAGNIYDPNKDQDYLKATQAVDTARGNKPVYSNPYEAQSKGLYDQIQNRSPFRYDVNADALYQQYRDQYRRQGQLAMRDTMGTAQTMTGGYGNTYAQTAAQQTYQGYLGQLNNKIPELYSKALERYQMEGDDLYNRYSMAKGEENQVYSRYRDSVDDYNKDLAYLEGRADKIYDRGVQRSQQQSQQTGEAYTRLIYLIENYGYKPTREEMIAAGFTEEQANRFA